MDSTTRRYRLRPVTEDDWPFLFQVYASTRAEELARAPWSEAEKRAFLEMQFNAQKRHYEQHFAQASFHVVEIDGAPAGRLYVDRRADEIRVIDIALLPAFQRAGIGGQMMRDILTEARHRALPTRIHVEHNNPAMRLYLRLGFRKIDEHGVYFLMECPPSPSTRPVTAPATEPDDPGPEES